MRVYLLFEYDVFSMTSDFYYWSWDLKEIFQITRSYLDRHGISSSQSDIMDFDFDFK